MESTVSEFKGIVSVQLSANFYSKGEIDSSKSRLLFQLRMSD